MDWPDLKPLTDMTDQEVLAECALRNCPISTLTRGDLGGEDNIGWELRAWLEGAREAPQLFDPPGDSYRQVLAGYAAGALRAVTESTANREPVEETWMPMMEVTDQMLRVGMIRPPVAFDPAEAQHG